MKITKLFTTLIIVFIIWYFTQDMWMPLLWTTDLGIQEEQQIQEEVQEIQEEVAIQQPCITVLAPEANTTVSFPLTITAQIDYACWIIFEAQAGIVTLEQDGMIISQIDPETGEWLFTVQGEYYLPENYPVTAQTTLFAIDEGYTWPAEIIITADNPCGDDPSCPENPTPILIPVTLP